MDYFVCSSSTPRVGPRNTRDESHIRVCAQANGPAFGTSWCRLVVRFASRPTQRSCPVIVKENLQQTNEIMMTDPDYLVAGQWQLWSREEGVKRMCCKWHFENVSLQTQNAGRPVNKGPERKQFRLVLFRFAYLQHIPMQPDWYKPGGFPDMANFAFGPAVPAT